MRDFLLIPLRFHGYPIVFRFVRMLWYCVYRYPALAKYYLSLDPKIVLQAATADAACKLLLLDALEKNNAALDSHQVHVMVSVG
jgi:hypothetical protein